MVKICLIFLVFISLSLFAFTSEEELIINSSLKPNQTYVYYYKKVKVESQNGLIETNDSSSSYKYFIVDDYKNEKFRLTFKSEDINNSKTQDDSINDILSKFDLKDITYETDKNGKYLGVVGWDTLSIIIRKVGSDIFEQSEYNDGSAQGNLVRYILKKVLDYFTSRSGFEESFFKETMNFHLAMGMEVNELEKQVAENIFIIPFGQFVKGSTRLNLSDEAEKGKKVLTRITIIQEEELKKAFESLLSLIIVDKGKLAEFMKAIEMYMIKETKIVYSESSGIPIQIETKFELNTKYPNKEDNVSEKTIMKFKELLVD